MTKPVGDQPEQGVGYRQRKTRADITMTARFADAMIDRRTNADIDPRDVHDAVLECGPAWYRRDRLTWWYSAERRRLGGPGLAFWVRLPPVRTRGSGLSWVGTSSGNYWRCC